MLNKEIQHFLPSIASLFEKHKIKNAWLFGSVLTPNFNQESDIDLLITIQEGIDPLEAGGHLWDLTFELEDLLHRKVDLVSERSIKNPYFLKEIAATKYFIYGK
jgi:predicted nucleotidyltransferase